MLQSGLYFPLNVFANNKLQNITMKSILQFTDETEVVKLVTFRISKPLYKELNEIAKEMGISVSAVLRTLVKYGISAYNKQNKKNSL